MYFIRLQRPYPCDGVAQIDLTIGAFLCSLAWHLRPHRDHPDGAMGDALYLQVRNGRLMILLLDAEGHGPRADSFIRAVERHLYLNPELAKCTCPCELLRALQRCIWATRALIADQPNFDATAILVDLQKQRVQVASNIRRSLYQCDGVKWQPIAIPGCDWLGFSRYLVDAENVADTDWDISFECSEVDLRLPHALIGSSDWIEQPDMGGKPFQDEIGNLLNGIAGANMGSEIVADLAERGLHHYSAQQPPLDDMSLFCLTIRPYGKEGKS